MTTLKNYRAINIAGDDGKIISVMMVHQVVGDDVIGEVLRRYHYENLIRSMEKEKDEVERRGRGEKVEVSGKIADMHKLNLLKKLIRLNRDTNGVVKEKVYAVVGGVFDCKDWKKRDEEVMIRAYNKMRKHGDSDIRIVETRDEIEWYTRYGEIMEMYVVREKVMFVDVKGEK